MSVPYGTRFVGREVEIGVCAELAAALDGEGQLVVLAGEPGIGKTRTATALPPEARDRGASVVWGRCHEGEGAPVYWPWVQALGAMRRQSRRDAERSRCAPSAPAGADGVPVVEGAPERARFDLFDRVATALDAAARLGRCSSFSTTCTGPTSDRSCCSSSSAASSDRSRSSSSGRCATSSYASVPIVARQLAAVVRLGRCVPLAGLARPAVQELLGDRLGRSPRRCAGRRGARPHRRQSVLRHRGGASSGRRSARRRCGTRQSAVPPGVAGASPPTPRPDPGAVAAAPGGRRRHRARVRSPRARRGSRAAHPPRSSTPWVRHSPTVWCGMCPARCSAMRSRTRSCARRCISAWPSALRAALHRAVGEALEAVGPADDERLPALAHHFFEAAQTGGSDQGRPLRLRGR